MKPQLGKTYRRGLSLVQRAFYHLTGLVGFGSNDFILSSFPRSGSTWVRFVFCHLLDLTGELEQEVNFTSLDEIMVELGGNNLLEPWEYQTLPRIIKTHRSFNPVFHRARGRIGIIRDPRDVMVSYYHFFRDMKGCFQGDFSTFIHSRKWGLEPWFKHYYSWKDHWNLVLQYRALRADPVGEISRTLDFMNLEFSSEIVQEAVERSSFKRVQELETERGKPVGSHSRMARKGEVRQWVDYFRERDMAYYRDLWDMNSLDRFPPEDFPADQ